MAYNVAGQSAIDKNDGSVYLVGFAGINDFDPGPAVYSPTGFGIADMYLQKLDADGNFVWAQWIGGPASDYVYDVTVGNDGSVYISGSCGNGADLDPGAGTFIVNTAEAKISFVAKYAADGAFVWASVPTFIDDGVSIAGEIVVDDNNNVFVGGYYSNTATFSTAGGPVTLTSSGLTDSYLWKLNSTGTTLWVKSYGGSDNEENSGLKADSDGNIYFAGRFSGTADFNPEAGFLNLTSNGSIDGYLIKVNTSGATVWAKSFGSTGIDFSSDLAVDNEENIILFGNFNGSFDADFSAGVNTLTSTGGSDFFVIKVDSSGNHIWSESFGGPLTCEVHNIDVDDANNIYFSGNYTGTTDVDPSTNNFDLPFLSSGEAFYLKLNKDGDFQFAGSFLSSGSDRFEDIKVDGNGNFYALGIFTNSLAYNNDLDTLVSLGSSDVFMMKFSQIDGGISQNGTTLSSESTYAQNYQWYDCNTNQIIVGENNPDFTATQNGSYAVIVSNGNSIDTSMCIVITTVGISENDQNLFSVYPNPATNIINISGFGEVTECIITDFTGKVLIESTTPKIEISRLVNGAYILQFTNENKTYTHKFIKL